MARIRQYTHRLNAWDVISSSVEANATELPDLQGPRAKLQTKAADVRALVLEQAALEARRREATALLQEYLREGDRLADLLRTGVRQHYGYTGDKLVEFGIEPLRPVSRTNPEQPPPPPAPEATAPAGSTPDTAR